MTTHLEIEHSPATTACPDTARPDTAVCPDWVDAEPFRAHVRDLICETGLSWRLVAAHAGVAPRAVRSLLHGRRGYTLHKLHVSIARALTTTSADSIADDQHLLIDATPTRQLLTELRSAGHGPALARHLPAGDLDHLDNPQVWRCSRATAARVTACYDLLTTTPHGRLSSRSTAASPAGRGRVAPAAPPAPPVESGRHIELDRKQTPGAWTTGSSSATTAGRNGC